MARFQKGFPSPNPHGRPKGSKSAPNLLRQDLISDDDVREVVAKVVTMAKAGDLAAAAIVLDRTVPKLKPRVADIDDETSLAEALQAARMRAIRGAGGGVSLETLVVLSSVSAAEPTIDAQAAPLPSLRTSLAPARDVTPAADSIPPPSSAALPPRPVRLNLPPTDESMPVYNPLDGIRHDS